MFDQKFKKKHSIFYFYFSYTYFRSQDSLRISMDPLLFMKLSSNTYSLQLPQFWDSVFIDVTTLFSYRLLSLSVIISESSRPEKSQRNKCSFKFLLNNPKTNYWNVPLKNIPHGYYFSLKYLSIFIFLSYEDLFSIVANES